MLGETDVQQNPASNVGDRAQATPSTSSRRTSPPLEPSRDPSRQRFNRRYRLGCQPSEDGDILDRTSPLAALGLAPRPSRPPPWCRPTRTVPASRRTRQQWLEFDTHPRGTSSSTDAQRGSNGRRDQHASEIRQARGDLTQFARRQTSVRSSQCDDIQTAIHRQIHWLRRASPVAGAQSSVAPCATTPKTPFRGAACARPARLSPNPVQTTGKAWRWRSRQT